MKHYLWEACKAFYPGSYLSVVWGWGDPSDSACNLKYLITIFQITWPLTTSLSTSLLWMEENMDKQMHHIPCDPFTSLHHIISSLSTHYTGFWTTGQHNNWVAWFSACDCLKFHGLIAQRCPLQQSCLHNRSGPTHSQNPQCLCSASTVISIVHGMG